MMVSWLLAGALAFGSPKVIKRAVVNEKMSNLLDVLQEARLEEALPDGYQFTDIDEGSIYRDLGFQVKDVLMEVNQNKVDSVTSASHLFIVLRNERDFTVKIKRGGKPMVFKYKIVD